MMEPRLGGERGWRYAAALLRLRWLSGIVGRADDGRAAGSTHEQSED